METPRWFSPNVEALAQDWRDIVIDLREWTAVDAEAGFAHGEAGGFFVKSGDLDGYAKVSADVCRAAHEKIASDLAFDLRLPVPPVVLTEPDSRRCAVSHLPFESPHKWGLVQPLAESVAAITPRLSAAASAMTVFDTWVDNRDRVNPGNVIVTTALAGDAGVAYIDYANSLSFGWQTGPAPSASAAVGPYPDLGSVDPVIMAQTLRAIEELSEARIRETVERIPTQFLPDARRTVTLEGLLARRDDLRSVFSAQCGDHL